VGVEDWLRGLGLERYVDAFRGSDIGPDVLPDLTDADLKDLGVSLGDRKRLLKAAQSLQEQGHGPVSPGAGPEKREEALPVEPTAERRQLTVMFADLVGSTALSTRLDPEEMREVLRAYQNAVAGEIARVDGHVAKLMGDGVLAYFGWPRAHEDDAERAVRAGLGIAEAIARLATPAGRPLAARVGIATGLVVVGDLLGEGAAREEAVVGETPNLAARLQEAAPPGSVVIAEGTRRLLGEVFELRPLGPTRLKGFATPVGGFRVLGEHPAGSRFEARQPGRPSPMVGRDQELALLLDRWRRAAAGEGQAVLLVGEAGIGKSRLVRAVLDAIAADDHVALRYQCSPHHTGTPLWPVARQVAFAAGLTYADPDRSKLDKLVALLRRGADDVAEAVPLVAALLGIDPDTRYPTPELTPQQRRARTLAVLVGQLLGLARRRGPVLMVLEDAHWIDPTTLELLGQTLDRIAGARVLMLLTTRPDGQPALGGHPHVTRLTLNRLGRGPAEAIVAQLAGDRQMPPEVLREIAARTDGVPLFVEELTKAVLEGGAAPAPVPASLHASLMARLDRVPGAKKVAQAAACIGREFAYPLLAAVSPVPEPALRAALDRLTAAELVFAQSEPPEASYSFKHALVRDAAHESLLKDRRQDLHARIAAALERQFAALVENAPEVLGHHYAEAGNAAAAARKFLEAGTRASARSSTAEAVGHFSRALELLRQLPATPDRDALELRMRTGLAAARMASDGYAASETVAAFAAAQQLAVRIGDRGAQFRALFGLYTSHYIRAKHAEALVYTEQSLRLAKEDGSEVLQCVAHRVQAAVLNATGRFVEARDHAATAMSLYRSEAHAPHAVEYGHDLGVAALAHYAIAIWHLGYPRQAAEAVRRAVGLAAAVDHANTATYAHFFPAGLVAASARDRPALDRASRELEELSRRHGLAQWAALGTVLHGCFLALGDGEAADAAGAIEDGLLACRGVGFEVCRPLFLGYLAEALLRVGDAAGAIRAASQALSLVEDTEERAEEPELLRLMGRIVAARSPAEGESFFRRAKELASRRYARSLELRAATSLARLWRDQGRRSEARDLLAPLYGWFTEGFATPDLIQAKELLDAL
jgi:predicted ATPase/class 3 adenylate cyclase